MSEFVVYGVPGSPYLRKALLALEEKRADYRLAVMGMGESKTPAHLARQPFARIPVLEHGDFSLYETQAILRYLDAVAPGPSLSPAEPKARARMDQIIGIVDSYVFPFITHGITIERMMSQVFWGREPDEETIANALPNAGICIRELDRMKGRSTWLSGESLSLADLMLAPHLDYFAMTPEGRDLMEDTGLVDWLERMRARDSFQATTMEKLQAAA
jgi:glutathione S-transferase